MQMLYLVYQILIVPQQFPHPSLPQLTYFNPSWKTALSLKSYGLNETPVLHLKQDIGINIHYNVIDSYGASCRSWMKRNIWNKRTIFWQHFETLIHKVHNIRNSLLKLINCTLTNPTTAICRSYLQKCQE